jgi:hypothetical protein
MAGQILILQPWIMSSIKETVDLIDHTAEGVPANLSFHPFPIESDQVSHLMSKTTPTLLLNNPHLNTIWSFHLPSIPKWSSEFSPEVKLPGHRPGLPDNVISFYIVPLDPAHSAGLAGHVPAAFF